MTKGLIVRDQQDPISRVAERIISRATLARGVVVLDNGLFGLESALKEANILVVKLHPGISDDAIKEQLLPHRIIVTNNPADFVDDAPVHEFGVIALDQLAFIDSAPSFKENRTVRLLSRAMSQYHLWEKGAKFLLELHEDGKHQLHELS